MQTENESAIKEKDLLAFEDITILDLARRFPGAYPSMILADFGARVIKVDPPAADGTRVYPDVDMSVTTEEQYAAYMAIDRNKRSIVLNLRQEQGRQVLFRLVQQADILIEGFSPGAMKKLGADYETLEKINPRLIYCSLSGYGQDGPYASRPGHDWNFSAMAGALSMVGEKGGRPHLVSNYLADMAGAGLHATIGILIALHARERTGRGQLVDISFLDGVLSLMVYDISNYFLTGKVPKRGESVLSGGAPFANVYRCKDGEYITIGAAEPLFWKNLCEAIGREDLIPHQNPKGGKKNEVFKALEETFLTKSRDEWEEFFKDRKTCFAPVNYLNEALFNAQVLHRKMVLEADHPKLGRIKQLGFPIKLSGTPAQLRNLGVSLGTNSQEILKEFGYSNEESIKLLQDGIVHDG